MDSSGVWNTYQQLVPPNNVVFYPVFEISINETTGDLLIRSSRTNSASTHGLTLLDLTTNTWTNYTNDDTNCLNANVFMATAVDSSGKIYTSVPIGSNSGQLTEFNPGTNTCTLPNINYLNAPTAVNSTLISDFTVRKKASGNLDIGFTRGENLHILEIDPATFSGAFTTATTIVPSAGQSGFSVLSDNYYFIVQNDMGWSFVDGNNNITSFNHNLPNYLAITTKKADVLDSSNGIINLVHKAFDAAFYYRMYKTRCNVATAICSAPEEIFTNNRDITQNIVFGVSQDNTTNQVSVVAVKTDGSGGIKRTLEQYDGDANTTPTITWDELHDVFPQFNPAIFRNVLGEIITVFTPDIFTIQTRTEDTTNGNAPVITNFTSDLDNDGNDDIINQIFAVHEIFGDEIRSQVGGLINYAPTTFEGFRKAMTFVIFDMNADANGVVDLNIIDIPDTELVHKLPEDVFVKKVKILQYNPTEAIMIILTNYGLLIKTAIDISGLALGTDDVSLNDTKVLLYPNPANDIVSFSNNSIKTITVYDINGRQVLSTKNSNSFSVKTLAQGIYIVKATAANNTTLIRRLIKNGSV